MNPIDALRSTDRAGAVAHQHPEKTGTGTKQKPDPAVQNIDSYEVTEAVKIVNDSLKALSKDERQFAVDDELGRLVVKIINSDTSELVRQIPSEEVLNLSKKMVEITKLLYGNNA